MSDRIQQLAVAGRLVRAKARLVRAHPKYPARQQLREGFVYDYHPGHRTLCLTTRRDTRSRIFVVPIDEFGSEWVEAPTDVKGKQASDDGEDVFAHKAG